MTKALMDLVLHPVRMQIVQALAAGHRLTTAQLAERLPNIPQASLYRHLNKLVEVGLIAIVEQNQVRGTVEKVYALTSTTPLNKDELTNEDHLRLFLAFTSNLAANFEQYLNQPGANPLQDRVSFRVARIYASDEEFLQFATALRQAYDLVINNLPSPERTGLDLATILIPVAHKNKEDKL